MKRPILIALAMISTLILQASGLNPVREYDITPEDYGIEYEALEIRSSDDMMLAGWYFPAPEDSYKLMILSHDGDGNMADMLEMAGIFISLGYHVITYDYRGYGKSTDFEVKERFLIYAQFADDLNAVLDHARKYYSRLRTIHLYGKGIGAALSIGVGCDRDDEVDRIIADSPYATFDDIRKKIKETDGRDVLVPIVYNKYVLEPYYTLEERHPKIKGILFIGSKDDPIYNGDYVKALSKRFSGASLYIARDANYESTYSSDTDAYFQELKKFCDS